MYGYKKRNDGFGITMEVRKGSVEKMVIKNIVQKIVLQYKKYGIYSAAKNAIYHVITRERAVSY